MSSAGIEFLIEKINFFVDAVKIENIIILKKYLIKEWADAKIHSWQAYLSIKIINAANRNAF